ncbi:MAG: multidrug effflux MFS transporter [Rhodoplanes sp.]|uniref:multidrug effflux MFS transporter n=1 Tax=Rhodoplanes sp. TaxID=1968906 RepID=UPI0017BB4B7C|nr:multidrug effflux MFS transporter [Rhodoplanes sp.]NVO14866.1 multidrug effflux MFS transporter [Rhodoplanes sp.]
MLRPDTFALTALLGLLTTIGPLSVDLYLPALPEIGRELAAPTAQVQWTISAYLVGFAFGQVGYGPLADIHGRRPVLLVALVAFCAATLVCAVASDIGWLIAARAIQAIGASGAAVLARAVVRDLYHGARAGREMSIMGMIMGLAPVMAPTAGGVLQAAFGWRSCFYFLFAIGAVAVVLVRRLLPETLPTRPPGRFHLGDLFRGCGVIARHRGFRAHLALISLSYAGLFAYISGSPFVLQDFFGLSPIEFGLAFAAAAIGVVAGSWLAVHIVMRIGLNRTIGLGAAALAAGAIILALTTAMAPGSTVAFVLPMMLYLAGMGLTMPQALAGALQPFPDRAGTASSLAGFVQQTAAAAAGAIVGHFLASTAWPLVIVVAVTGTLTLAVWATTEQVREMPVRRS